MYHKHNPIDDMLIFNEKFVEERQYENFASPKRPQKQVAIVTCMDTRLTAFLPAALGLKDGDVKMIRNAGGNVAGPWDSAMRSILVAVYELGVTRIMIIGHTDCGVQGMEAAEMLHLMEQRGIDPNTILTLRSAGIDLDSWLTGFSDTADAIIESANLVRNHPLLPRGIEVSAYIFDTATGKLNPID